MKKTLLATAIALRDLGYRSEKDLNQIQLKVFLAQESGLPLGYGFVWGINGPYSEDLTRDIFEIIPRWR